MVHCPVRGGWRGRRVGSGPPAGSPGTPAARGAHGRTYQRADTDRPGAARLPATGFPGFDVPTSGSSAVAPRTLRRCREADHIPECASAARALAVTSMFGVRPTRVRKSSFASPLKSHTHSPGHPYPVDLEAFFLLAADCVKPADAMYSRAVSARLAVQWRGKQMPPPPLARSSRR